MSNSTADSPAKRRNYQENRAKLRELSNVVKQAIDSGSMEVQTINQGLIELYKHQGHSEFKTFQQWRDEGKAVKRGSKAFLVWGSPKNIQHPDPESEEDEFNYFPICYLFGDGQVTERRES